MMGGLNSLLFVMMLTGGRMSASLGQSIVAMRRQSYEKLRAFIQFIASTLVTGFFYWRGIPVVKNASGSTAVSSEQILGQLQEGQKDNLAIWFFTQVIDKGVNMVLELLAPSALEESLMTQLMSTLAGGGGGMTPNQIRSTGGRTYT